MIVTQVIVKDGLTEPLEKFGKRAPKMLDSVLLSVGYKYRAFIRRDFIAGQMLYSRPGIGPLWMSLFSGRAKGKKHVAIVGAKKTTTTSDMGGFLVRKTFEASHLGNIFEHAGGYTIVPKKKKYLTFQIDGKWIRVPEIKGKQRPFMSASAAAFNWAAEMDASAEKMAAREMKKAGLG